MLPCSLSKTRVGGLCCHVPSQKPGSGACVAMFSLKNPGRGFVLPCSLSKTRVGGLCCHVLSQKPGSGVLCCHVLSQKPGSGVLCCLVRSQKPGSGVCVAVFALKNCPCSLSKTLFVLPVVALKNPGRGLVFTLKNPGRVVFVDMCPLKNPGRGLVLIVCTLKKTLVRVFAALLALKTP